MERETAKLTELDEGSKDSASRNLPRGIDHNVRGT